MIITFTQNILEILIEFVVDRNDPLLSLIHRIENLIIDTKQNKYTYLVSGRELNRVLEVVNECLNTEILPNYEINVIRHMAKKE